VSVCVQRSGSEALAGYTEAWQTTKNGGLSAQSCEKPGNAAIKKGCAAGPVYYLLGRVGGDGGGVGWGGGAEQVVNWVQAAAQKN
jgi:hypothetical protein